MNEQLELFSDGVPGEVNDPPTRKQFEFVGTTSATCSLDPGEYRGMSVPQITEEIKAVLRGIKPDADFFEQDLVEAANVLASR